MWFVPFKNVGIAEAEDLLHNVADCGPVPELGACGVSIHASLQHDHLGGCEFGAWLMGEASLGPEEVQLLSAALVDL